MLTLGGQTVYVAVKPQPVTGGAPATPDQINRLAKGVTNLDSRVADESKAILKSNSFRTKRPNGRPKKTRGHGVAHLLLEDIGAKMPDKKEKPPEKAPAVPEAPLPDYVRQLMLARPECDWLKERSEGQSIVTRFLS
jgi:hypothetical protein